MPTHLTDVEIEEISILGKTSRPAVRAARIAIFKHAKETDNLVPLRSRVLNLRAKVDAALIKFKDQPRDENGRWADSGGGGADSSDTGSGGDSSAAKWAGRIANVAAIASLAIPGFAGVRAAKLVFDGTRQVLSNLKFLAAPSTLGRTTVAETARYIATTPAARKKVVAEVVTAMAEKNNVAASTAAGALSAVLGFLADKREAEISKADNRDPILEQLRLIQDALAALDTESEDDEGEEHMDFDAHTRAIQKRDGGSRLDALRKARREHPTAFEAYRNQPPPLTKSAGDYEALIKVEINGSSMPRHIAEQRLLQKYGRGPT